MQFICHRHSTLFIVTAQALQLVVQSSLQGELCTYDFIIQYNSICVFLYVPYPQALSELEEAEAHLKPQVDQALLLLQEKDGVREGGGERLGEGVEGEGGGEVTAVGGDAGTLVSSMRHKLKRDKEKRRTNEVSVFI